MVIPVEKMILVKSAGHPGLLALASRLCPRSVWWGGSGAKGPSLDLSKADLGHKHSMWAYNPAYHLRPKKTFFIYRFQCIQFYVHFLAWIGQYWWTERKRSRRQQGVERPKNTCIWELSNSSSFKSVRIEKAWLVLICSCHKVNTLWTYQLRWRLRLSWNWNHLESVWRHVLSWF